MQLVHGMPKRFYRFENVSDANVILVIRRTQAKTFPMDFVPTTIIKSCADVFGPLIATLANLSFAEGKFPDMFRAGQVTPLLKKPGANTADMSNYRPITNLNTIGKILEHLAMNQLRRNMESTSNGAPLQSAYRAFHSTETAMTLW